MDAMTGAVIIAGLATVGKPTAQALQTIIGRMLGPSVDAVGKGIAAPLREWAKRRAKRAAAITVHASQILHAAEVEPIPVPGRILLPILEHSSLEDNPQLQQMWASLLANAANPSTTGNILPAFHEILRQLTSDEARILDWMFRNSRALSKSWQTPKHYLFISVSRTRIMSALNLELPAFNLMASDLHRLRLIEGGQLPTGLYTKGGVVMSSYNQVELTPLGKAFVVAVNPPGTDLGGIYLHPPTLDEDNPPDVKKLIRGRRRKFRREA